MESGESVGGPRPIRIVIVDPAILFRHGLRAAFGSQPDLQVVGEVARLDQISTVARGDIVFFDIHVESDNWDTVRSSSLSAVLVGIISEGNYRQALLALRAGVRALVSRDSSPEHCIDVVRTVAKGEASLPAGVQAELLSSFRNSENALTPREREIVTCVAEGLRNAEVANRLFVSESTVKTHLNNIFSKLAIRDRTELTLYAVRSGMVALNMRNGGDDLTD